MAFLNKKEAFLLAASILFSLQLLANGQINHVEVVFTSFVPVFENATNGAVLTYINDTNPAGNNKVVSITYSGFDRAFIIEKVVGEPKWQVILNRTLDFDRGEKNIDLRFKATGGSSVYNAESVIQLIVKDVNDNSPQFENQPYNADVKEDERTGRQVYSTIHATDIDDGPGGYVRYKLEGGGGTGQDTTFIIDAYTGVLTLNGTLDYETKRFYHYIVTASDQGAPSLSSTTDLFVTVKDVQDSPPVFTNLPYVKSVDENTATGHAVITVKAVDQDQAIPDQIGYNITHTDCPGLFALDANSGIIYVDSTLDRDNSTLKNNAGRCTITVQATEQSGPNTQKGNFTATETVIITVNDVNDNAPTFSGTSFSANITENSPDGTPLQLDRGQQIVATDIDQGSNSEIHLSLLGADDTFELVTSSLQGSGTVQLRVKNSAMLDFEARQSLNVQITASDNDQSHATATATVRVNIENVNENSPAFANSEYTAAVLEGSVPRTHLATVIATDADAGRYGVITYMLRNDRGLFRIDSHTGAVTVASDQTDREREDRYNMEVVATDGGGLKQTVPLIVNITDRNDNPPVFQPDQYDAVLREGATVFSRPLQLEATDADEFNTPNGNVTFSIHQTSPSDLQNHFHLDPVSGKLTVTRALDFKTLHFSSAMAAGVVDLLVVASDRGTPPLWTTATVAVTLIDIHGKSPVFQNQLYSTQIPTSSTEGTQPAKWTDSLTDGSLKYACAGDNVHMLWNFTLSAGESLDDVQWFYQGRSSEMIAVLTHGNFLPLPSFSHRVHFIPNGGIIVDHVTVQDSGNYSVEISGHGDLGTFFRITRTIILQVGADLMTTDGHIHVSENPVAVHDKRTDQWSIELHCGTFTYLGQPPFDVEWMTPSGKLMSSSTYKDGQFKLLVSAPVQGGNYSCRIPVLSIRTACLPEGNGANKGKATTYMLDQTESRLTLLEAHQTALQKENDALKAENVLLKNSDSNLSDRVHQLEARTSHHVSFHARNLRNTSIQHDSPLIVDHVIINQGNCYSTCTGKFTAPFNGTYFFIGTSGSWATGQTGQFELTVEGQQISFVSNRDNGPLDAASVHGVVHLTQGDTVWLKVSSGIEFWSAATSFSGFLVSPDS